MATILWLTEHYPPSRGGMSQSCDRIVHGLRRAGERVDVLHFSRRRTHIAATSQLGGRLIVAPLGDDPAHGLNVLWAWLERDAGRNAYTHVAAFGGVIPLLAGPVFASWLRLPLLTLIRGNDFDAGIFTPKRSDLLLTAIERSSAICVVSRDKGMKIRTIDPACEPIWIPNGIDGEEWSAIPSDGRRGARWREEHVSPGRRVLGMVGEIKRKKGAILFMESLLSSGEAHRFHLKFTGEIDEEIRDWLAIHPGIEQSIEPFGDRFELIHSYLAADFIVIPSFYDGTPNVMLEAAALGIPLIASTAGGMGDLLVDDRHGFLFHPGDHHGCRRAILRAARATRDDLRRFASECRELARAFDSNRETEAYRAVITAMTNHRTGPAATAISPPPDPVVIFSGTLLGEASPRS